MPKSKGDASVQVNDILKSLKDETSEKPDIDEIELEILSEIPRGRSKSGKIFNNKKTRIEWNNKLIMEFIRLYESHPVLWDPKHNDHKNRRELNNAWQNIADEMSFDVTVDALRKKKESLMTTYRVLAKKVQDSRTTRSGANDVHSPSWFAFAAIDRFIRSKGISSLSVEETNNEDFSEDDSFLEITKQDTMINEETIHEAMINEETKQDSIINEETIQEQDNIESVCQTMQGNISMERQSRKACCTHFVSPQGQGTPKRRGREGPSSIEKHLKQMTDVLTNFIATELKTQQSETLQDAPALYGQLLTIKLRRLSPRTRLILQNQIDNLLFQAELNELDPLND